MTIFVPIMMFGWLPFTLTLFVITKPQQAAVVALIFGWLFLPGATYAFQGFPDYTKIIATCLPIVLGTLLFDAQRFHKLHPNRLDIPVIVWCCSAFISSVNNDLGVYNGISSVLQQILHWGFPYAIGKMYFSDRQGLCELAEFFSNTKAL